MSTPSETDITLTEEASPIQESENSPQYFHYNRQNTAWALFQWSGAKASDLGTAIGGMELFASHKAAYEKAKQYIDAAISSRNYLPPYNTTIEDAFSDDTYGIVTLYRKDSDEAEDGVTFVIQKREIQG